MRPLIVLVALSPLAARARPAVLLFPTIGSPAQVTLNGRVLKHAPGGSSALSRNLRSLTSSNWEGASVELRYAGRTGSVTSGNDGNFSLTFSGAEKPFEVGFATAEAHVGGADVGVAMVNVVSPKAPFIVVSDFDDTLAVTNVAQGAGMLKSLAEDAKSQPVVEGMSDFYACLEEDKGQRPGFTLVSGSPSQFLPRVREFLTNHKFPVFGINLRDLGPSTLSNYKQPVIRSVFKGVPNAAVLVGDSGEKDPEVYAEIRSEFPERVKAIYIRNAGGKLEDPKRFDGMLLFKQPVEAARDAASKGLVTNQCVETRFKETKK
jgi:phosphatidate phosphatase APP1